MGKVKTRLTAAVAVAIATGFGAAAAQEQPTVNWNLSIWGKERAFTQGVEALSDYVAEQSDGKFNIKIYYGEALSDAKENLDGIKIGAFQMAGFCASYHPAKTPTLSVLDLPFLPLGKFDVQKAVHEAIFAHPAVEKDLKRWNAKLLFSGILPQYEFLGVGDPPKTLEDWDGMRVRALGGLGEAMKKLGAVPTTVPAPEVYTLMDRGTVSAASFPYTYAHGAYRLHEVADWFTSNMSPGTVTCPIVVNIEALNDLPEDYRKTLFDGKEAAYDALKQAYKDADAKFLPLFKENMTEIQYSEEQLDEFRAIAGKPVWDAWIEEMSAKGLPAQELLDLVMSTADKAS